MSVLSDARAAMAEVEGRRTALIAQVEAERAERAPLIAKIEANQKRRQRLPIIANLAGTIGLYTRASINPEVSHYRGDTRPKALLDGLTSGGFKLSIGNDSYAGYTAKGLPGRIRVPEPATVRTWKRATAARERAEQRARNARVVELAAATAAFEAGTKISLAELLPDLALTAKLKLALAALPRSQAEFELNRLTNNAEFGDLAIARRHLAHTEKRTEDAGCTVCQRAARERREAEEWRARITALPRQKAMCPMHGKVKVGYAERLRNARVRLAPDAEPEWVENLPVWYCPVDLVQYHNISLFLAEREQAAKKAKRGKAIAFTCPNAECGEDVTAVPNGDEIICLVCEAALVVGSLKTHKVVA